MQDPERTFSYVPSGQRQHNADQNWPTTVSKSAAGLGRNHRFIFLIARYLAFFLFSLSQQNTLVFCTSITLKLVVTT